MGKKVLRCAEFFSGIGGMRYACHQAAPSDTSVEFIASFDINQIANHVYHHNFQENPITVNVEHLPVKYYEDLRADIWLMSPPCQPYTRGGSLLDDQDNRAIGLLHLVSVLQKMENPPDYIFVENVLNFEVSKSRSKLIDVLNERKYVVEEYLVSPLDIGIPNYRLRYYLIARRSNSSVVKPLFKDLLHIMPQPHARPVSEYLRPPTDPTPFLVPTKYITDYKEYRHDVVHPQDVRSTTFTKAYGSKHIIGTGSFLQTQNLHLRDYRKDDPQTLLTLGLRFFTPTEVALLHAFPLKSESTDNSTTGITTLEFPSDVSIINQYRLLGNSLNVAVVNVLLNRLYSEALFDCEAPFDSEALFDSEAPFDNSTHAE